MIRSSANWLYNDEVSGEMEPLKSSMKLSHPFPPSFFIVFLAVADKDVVIVSWDYTRHITGSF